MDSNRYTPKTVAEENLYFSIPLYQRLFAWGEPQVRGLLEDLFSHFLESKKPYYLGMLSCIKMPGYYDLIDGQQRFIVMTLLGIVFQQYDKQCKDFQQWKDFLAGGKDCPSRLAAKTRSILRLGLISQGIYLR